MKKTSDASEDYEADDDDREEDDSVDQDDSTTKLARRYWSV